MKIRVGCPAYRGLTPWAKKSLNALLDAKIEGYEFEYMEVSGNASISEARSILINKHKSFKKFQKISDFDLVIQFDDDMEFTVDEITKLIDTVMDNNLMIASALYKSNEDSKLYNAGDWGEYKGEKVFGLTDKNFRLTGNESGLVKVDWFGTGLFCAKRELFEKLKYPWFRETIISLENENRVCSEDMYFCESINKIGIPLFVNCEIRPKHFKSRKQKLQQGDTMENPNQNRLPEPNFPVIQSTLTDAIYAIKNNYIQLKQVCLNLQNENEELKKQISELEKTSEKDN